MTIKVFEKGFNYSQDGPGNRLVFHLQGCNMHCPWCANPDGISLKGTLVADSKALLPGICPYGAIGEGTLDRERCAACADRPCLARKTRGIRLSCREYTLDELVEEAVRSRPLFFDGGGVTFTGGEPTCQFDALREALQRLRAEGIHTALETNASHQCLPELLPLIDALMVDCKHWNDHTLREVTGVGTRQITANFARIAAQGVSAAIRIPLIDGFNASPQDLAGFSAYFAALDLSHCTLELLPFHEYGRDKWAACGLIYRMQGGKVLPETVRRFGDAFREQGITMVRS